MIILFTNIKGGVGKTSTCALFAQYLYKCGYPVMALDADIQASLSRHRERELAANPDVAVPWEVSTIDTTDRQSLQSSIGEAKKFEGIVLIDMPGTLNASRSALPLAIARTSICCIRLRIWLWFLSPTTSTPSMPRVSSSRSSSGSRIYGWYSCPTASARPLGRLQGKNTTENRADEMKQREEAAVEHAFDAIVEQINV